MRDLPLAPRLSAGLDRAKARTPRDCAHREPLPSARELRRAKVQCRRIYQGQRLENGTEARALACGLCSGTVTF